MDQIPAILAGLASLVVAAGGLELRHRGRAKELSDDRDRAETRARVAEADAYRRLLLLRRVGYDMTQPGDTPTTLFDDIKTETT